MNKWEKEVQQSLLKDEQRVLKVLRMAYADVLRETNDRMADLFARITADPTDSAAVYQFRYQQQLQEQLEKILDGFADSNYQTISEYLEKSYENGYLGAMYDIHRQGIPVVTPIQQEQVVRAVTLDSPISIPMYTRLGNNIAQLKTAIAAEVTRGAASGSMWKDVAARISDKGNVSAYNAMRIARTEGHRIQCAAQMDACRSAREAGADVVKQWDSTMDDRTRETHRQLHGQLRELDAPFEVGGMRAMQPGSFGRPEEDIHCRCALLQRARWALSEAELQALRETDAAKELASVDGFEDFKGKYLDFIRKLPENSDNPLDNSAESGIIESGIPYLDAKPRLEKHGIEDCYNTTNPHLNGGEEYTRNCQRCIPAYEARRRGFDVTAKPAALGDEPLKNTYGSHGWANVFENGENNVVSISGTSAADVKKNIRLLMQNYGDGARVAVKVGLGKHNGHVFIAEQIDGKTVFIDPQTGDKNCAYWFMDGMITPDKTRLLRIDDKGFTNLIEECVE